MCEMKITFKNPEEILDFVNTVSKYDFDMDLKKGRVVVDEMCIRDSYWRDYRCNRSDGSTA